MGGGVVQDGADQQSQEFGVVQQTGHHAQQLLLVVLEHSRPKELPELLRPGEPLPVPDLSQHVLIDHEDLVGNAEQNIQLGGEMVVDGPLGQVGGVHDILHGGLVIPLLGKEPCGGLQNELNGLFRVFVSGHGAPFLQTDRRSV